MSATEAATVRMANQIATNFRAIGHAAAVAATADHIQTFWDPRMKKAAFDLLARNDHGFSEAAAAALGRLATGDAPPSQTPATSFNAGDESGHSDAG